MRNTFPNFEVMDLRELSAWFDANNNGIFDSGEMPTIDGLTDEEETQAREEYESACNEIAYAAAIGPCGK